MDVTEYSTNHTIRVLIAGDIRLLCEALASMLARHTDITVVGLAASRDEVLDKIKQLQPRVVLVDSHSPDEAGIELTREIRQMFVDVKVVVFGVDDLESKILECIEAGANGYILKEASLEDALNTIRSVYQGIPLCSPQMVASLFTRIAKLASMNNCRNVSNSARVTARELDIIHLIADGLSDKDIAKRLCLETQTVKNHVHRILEKLHLHRRYEAVQYAHEKGLLRKIRLSK